MIDPRYVILDMNCDSAEQALRMLADRLVQGGAAKASFPDAIIAREAVYPTGLPGEACDIAIPHTTGNHVNTPAIAVGVLKKPVTFAQMGSPEIALHPRLVLMLAVTDPQTQLGLLQNMMRLIQDGEQLHRILQAQDEEQVADLLRQALGENG